MPEVILLAGMVTHVPLMSHDMIGIDRGALVAMNEGRKLVCAVGDFDSISEAELAALKEYTRVIRLDTHKNETDSEAALRVASELGYDRVILYGGLGGRIDHELINLSLMVQRQNITVMNEKNRIRLICEGTVYQPKEYKYLSFIPLSDCILSLNGVAYPLDHRKVRMQDTFTTSNEILDEAEITLHEGKMLMIECND